MSLEQTEKTSVVDLSIVHDHYKDSFAHVKEWERRRDRTFFAVAALMGFLFLGVYYPSTVKAVFTEATIAKAKVDPTKLPVEILVSAGWSMLFALVLRHCQASITIDRQYNYLHGLEEKLASMTGDAELFQREGKAYLSKYPAFSKWSYLFYAAIFPLTVIAVSTKLLTYEFRPEEGLFHFGFDLAMSVGAAMSFFLYRLWPLFPQRSKKGSA